MTELGFAVPEGATDCHMHIFGDMAAYPPAAWRAYDPTPATLPVYDAEAARMGFSRVVFVQPSAYGTDNACMKAALKARGASSRGVAVIDASTKDSELKALDKLGVRGVRLNLVSNGIPDVAAAVAQLQETAARVGKLGWHVQIFALPSLLAGLAPTMCWPCCAKVSGANRVSRAGGGFEDAVPVIRALVEANPARAVWGTDWPHIGPHRAGAPEKVVYMPHDNLGLLRLLGMAVADAGVIRQVLVDNPAKLYGF